MSTALLERVVMGDMAACYYIDENGLVEFQLLPAGLPPLERAKKHREIDVIAQYKLVGDGYLGGYACGGTLRQSGSAMRMKYASHNVNYDGGAHVELHMQDERGYRLINFIDWTEGDEFITSRNEFINGGGETVTLELLSSFNIAGITPYTEGDAHGDLYIHRLQSVWSMEGRLCTQRAEDLQLEPSWAGHAVRCVRFGQAGSMPVNHWFPFALIEDRRNNVFWGAQIAHNASWQLELYRKDDGLSLSGGLADREFGHWQKNIQPGERFASPEAILTVCRGDVDSASRRLAGYCKRALDEGPASEQTLPVMFNEYCTTWGCPSHENIKKILSAVKGRGFEYFVIDCGWYKADGVPWDVSMGDYEESRTLFPDGLKNTAAAIREAGMIPGLWFEIENVGSASKVYNDGHLLKKDGGTLTTTMRRFWDMRDPYVRSYLHEKVAGTLRRCNFGYIKIDYNDSIGIGCDGAESLGEGLRKNMECAFGFMESLKRDVPGLIIENCSSGGHRLEPKLLSATAMSSFSDAHECLEIPIIAANLHRVMQPRQSQIWAVIRKTDPLSRIAYSITNTFLGRMCVSGDVTELSPEQWALIDSGIAFYKKAAPIIKEGRSQRFGPEVISYRHPEGWQGVVRKGEAGTLAVLHAFDKAPEVIELPVGDQQLQCVYCAPGDEVTLEGEILRFSPKAGFTAAAALLK